jgi:hypothetical protein
MNRRSAALCFVVITACLTLGAQQAPPSKSSYEALVERVKGGDKTVDFRQLRLAYVDSPNFSRGPDTDPQKKAMMTSLNKHDFADAIKNADIVLAANYVDMDAHFAEYVAQRESKNQEQAEFHKFVFQGLLKSITDSGDGKTPETAYQVIAVHEEYVLLRSMGVGFPESQSLMQKNGHSYDALKFEDPAAKQKVTLYFNVDIPIKHGL